MPAERRVLLADADAFFVAVARLVDPEGAGKATLLIVGGSAASRGVVCSASYETRRYGVRSAMPIAQALRLCPAATCVPVPRAACAEQSRAVRRVLQRFTPCVEGASIDEWYLDLTGTEAMYGDEPLARTAHLLRAAVREATGLAISVGGGSNKLVAKLAVELAKPKPGTGGDGVHIVAPGAEAAFVRRFALADIPQFGPELVRRLERAGLRTVAQVVEQDAGALVRRFGAREGRWLHDRVRGIDRSRVAPREVPRSISREDTFAMDTGDDAILERELLRLVVRAAADLRTEGMTARTITVKLRDHDFTTRQAGRTLPEGVMADRVIHEVARSLLHRLRTARRCRARLLGVTLGSLEPATAAGQLGLFGAPDAGGSGAAAAAAPGLESDRDRVLARTVDALRERFGAGVIAPARIMGKPRA